MENDLNPVRNESNINKKLDTILAFSKLKITTTNALFEEYPKYTELLLEYKNESNLIFFNAGDVVQENYVDKIIQGLLEFNQNLLKVKPDFCEIGDTKLIKNIFLSLEHVIKYMNLIVTKKHEMNETESLIFTRFIICLFYPIEGNYLTFFGFCYGIFKVIHCPDSYKTYFNNVCNFAKCVLASTHSIKCYNDIDNSVVGDKNNDNISILTTAKEINYFSNNLSERIFFYGLFITEVPMDCPFTIDEISNHYYTLFGTCDGNLNIFCNFILLMRENLIGRLMTTILHEIAHLKLRSTSMFFLTFRKSSSPYYCEMGDFWEKKFFGGNILSEKEEEIFNQNFSEYFNQFRSGNLITFDPAVIEEKLSAFLSDLKKRNLEELNKNCSQFNVSRFGEKLINNTDSFYNLQVNLNPKIEKKFGVCLPFKIYSQSKLVYFSSFLRKRQGIPKSEIESEIYKKFIEKN